MKPETTLEEPYSFFSTEKVERSVLWLPPLDVHRFTQRLDWLCGLSLSKLIFREKKKWSEELSNLIKKEELKLDVSLPIEKHTLVKLPPGFKCSMGLIMDECLWESPDEVFSVYKKVSLKLNPELTQSPYIWKSTPSQLLKEVQWIKI